MEKLEYIHNVAKCDKTIYSGTNIDGYKQLCYQRNGDIVATIDEDDELIVRDEYVASIVKGKLFIKKKILKRTRKSLMIIEAGYIYCLRHNLDTDTFIDDVFLQEDFDSSENSEYDNICKDLRAYRYIENYKLIEITESEYNLCVLKMEYYENKNR